MTPRIGYLLPTREQVMEGRPEAVLLPALRHPVLLAHLVATLDQIAEGRVILGVGIASDVANIRAEFAAAGVSHLVLRFAGVHERYLELLAGRNA